MEASYLEKKVRKSWIFRNRFPIILGVLVLTVILVAFAISFHTFRSKPITNAHFIYNTWKVEKLYKNGKLVINGNKYHNLFLQVHKDGTAEWFKENKRLKVHFSVTRDGTQIIFDDGLRIEEVETIFELRHNVFRFGKKGINSHYEYVLTAIDLNDGNFF